MQKLPPRYILAASITFILTIAVTFVIYEVLQIRGRFGDISGKVERLEGTVDNVSLNLSDELFQDHLSYVENISLRNTLAEFEAEIKKLTGSDRTELQASIEKIYQTYEDYQGKVKRNSNVKVDVGDAENISTVWGGFLLDQDFETLETTMSEEIKKLDEAYRKYQATLPPPVAASGQYSYINVATEKGNFNVYLIKMSKSTRVKTIAAAEGDCKNDCPTKTLDQYVKENSAYAGMAGSYSCPADYSHCSEKKWSFDFALYDTNDGKWLNKKALSWGDTGLFTFNGGSVNFYKKSSDFGGGSVTAAISNFPSLLKNSEIVVDSGDVDSFQTSKGLRGAIGVGEDNLYLAYISNASVIDAAFVMRALGAKHALNLDGGGSAAMYVNGSYVVGPGRPLPNAILLIK